ncbi:MAG: disulfide bond formation protein B [Bdellovibrionota bacterium]
MFPRIESYLIWIIALSATAGSLFFSEILKIPPCDLCWYQRIFIYPLVFMMPIAIFKEDFNFRPYTLSLLIPGTIVSLYHNLLYYGVIEKPLVPCKAGVSCTSREFEFFGFLGIPLMSLLAFLAMIMLITATYRKKNDEIKS